MKRHVNKQLSRLVVVLVATVSVLIATAAVANATRGGEGGRGDGPIVYVASQDLYYDSIITADPLPWKGPFQQLFPPGTNPDFPELTTLSTEYGPGTPGHHGGRWWVDVNENGVQDEEDHYFGCPLLGPGRDSP